MGNKRVLRFHFSYHILILMQNFKISVIHKGGYAVQSDEQNKAGENIHECRKPLE